MSLAILFHFLCAQHISDINTSIILLTQYRAGDKIKKNEMGWACGAYGWGEGSV